MDEILATIRRIIAEDERSSGAASRGGPAVGSPADLPNPRVVGPRDAVRTATQAAGEDDILDLIDALDEDGSVQRLAPLGTAPGGGNAEAAPAPLPVEINSAQPVQAAEKPAEASRRTDQPPVAEEKPAEAGPRTDRAVPAETEPQPDRAVGPGLSPPTAQPAAANDERLVSEVALLAAATALGRLGAVPRTRREPPLVGGRPLDDIVRELLRPLLRTWLDENLPGIVERLVEAEIARISARSGPG